MQSIIGNLFTQLLMKVRLTKPTERGTGQVFFRKQGQKAPDGRTVYAIVGVVAVPEGFEFKNEHQAPVFLTENGKVMGLGLEEQEDRTEEASGIGLGTLATATIWRF